MTPELLSLDPLTDPRWSDFVARAPGAGPFHHPGWLRLLRDTCRYPVRAYAVEAGGELQAGLPLALVPARLGGRRLVGLPFADALTPLSCDPGDEELLSDGLARVSRKERLPVEVHGPMAGHEPRPGAGYLSHRLDLGAGIDAVTAGTSSAARRGARRAAREGLEVERRCDPAALEEFFRLHLATRHRLGVPTQPRHFIARFAGLFDEDLGFVLVVRDAGRPVAAAVFLVHRGTWVYKYGASDSAALPKRPNNLLFMEAIRLACAEGAHTLDFGRTDLGHDSLCAFKRSWGAREEPLVYVTLNGGTPRRRARGVPYRRLSSGLIRHTPPVVGQSAGQLLYRRWAP